MRMLGVGKGKDADPGLCWMDPEQIRGEAERDRGPW